jgi:hypothetical protein
MGLEPAIGFTLAKTLVLSAKTTLDGRLSQSVRAKALPDNVVPQTQFKSYEF